MKGAAMSDTKTKPHGGRRRLTRESREPGEELCDVADVDADSRARMTAAVRKDADAQAPNRRKTREYQAPVFAASSCETPRKDWGSDGLQNLFSQNAPRGAFLNRGGIVVGCASHARRITGEVRNGVVGRGDKAGTRTEKSRASAGLDSALLDARTHWNHWAFRAMRGEKIFCSGSAMKHQTIPVVSPHFSER
jgi:hypothetical protein